MDRDVEKVIRKEFIVNKKYRKKYRKTKFAIFTNRHSILNLFYFLAYIEARLEVYSCPKSQKTRKRLEVLY